MSPKMTVNFASDEFACKCGCGEVPDDIRLYEVCQHVRDICGVPITVNSGRRCLEHNRAIGSKDTSQHILGKAADLKCPNGMTLWEFHEAVCVAIHNLGHGGIGVYTREGFIHLDIRDGKGRWLHE